MTRRAELAHRRYDLARDSSTAELMAYIDADLPAMAKLLEGRS